MTDEALPRWAATARAVFRVALCVVLLLWWSRAVVWMVDVFIDIDYSGGAWPSVSAAASTLGPALFAVTILTGLIWLAGAFVAGFRESS
jgi:hypothetical protein